MRLTGRSWGRRDKKDAAEKSFKPVASEERSALLSGDADSADAGGGLPEDRAEPGPREVLGGDATRRMLTALGRFQRQIGKARQGAPQEAWSDECMNQIIMAVELALSEGWDEMAEALTETGRVLQSYEDAGQAAAAAPFLSETYEILCLMASDLIIGKMRPQVLKKWRERYEGAIEELDAAGIPLVRDDASCGPAAAEQEDVSEDASPFDLPPSLAADSTRVGYEEDLPTLDDLPPLKTGDAGAGLYPPEEGEAAPEESRQTAPASPQTAPASRQTGAELEPLEPLGRGSAPCFSTKPALDADVVALLDALCEGFSQIEKRECQDLRGTLGAMGEHIGFLGHRAQEEMRQGAVSACRTMEEMLRFLEDAPSDLDDRFFELAYAFCGVYAEAQDAADDPFVGNWTAECRHLMVAWAEEEAPASPEGGEEVSRSEDSVGAEETPVEDGEPARDAMPRRKPEGPVAAGGESVMTLLETARSAVTAGCTTDAKLFALRAAAGIAEEEVQRSEARVRKVEQALQDRAADIERARETVQECEEEVIRAENLVRDMERRVADSEKQTGEVRDQLAELDVELADMESRIRELEAQRDAIARRRDESRASLEDKARAADQAGAELAGVKDAEDAARVELEDGRQRVKVLQRKRSEIEAAMERARDVLNRHRNSLADIEQMVERVGSFDSAEAGGEGEGDLLF